MSIGDRQNEPRSLDRLAAQRLLYQRAKTIRNIGIVLVLIVAALGVLAAIVNDPAFSRAVPLATVLLWFLDQQIVKRNQVAFVGEAAVIQEDFDR